MLKKMKIYGDLCHTNAYKYRKLKNFKKGENN